MTVDTDTLRAIILESIAQHERTMSDLRAIKPAVIDAHSDGRRVKYVRSETAVDTLRGILDLLA